MFISRRPALALSLTILVWGLNFPVIKIALEAMSPFVVNAIRFTFSVAVLGWMHAMSGRDFWGPLKQAPVQIILLGLLGYVGYQVCFIVGINRTTAGVGALIMASAPAFTALGSRMFGLEKLPFGAWLGLGIGLAGTALVVVGNSAEIDLSTETLTGNLLLLLGAILWAAYTLISKPVMNRGISATGLTFFGMLMAFPLLVGLGLTEISDVNWDLVNWKTWTTLVFSGLLSTGTAYVWWNVAVRDIGPTQTALASNVVPLIALVTGVILLGETITFVQILGGLAIIGGLMVMRRARRKVIVFPPPPHHT